MSRVAIFLAVVFLVAAAVAGSFVWDAYLVSPSENAPSVTVSVEQGQNAGMVANLLEEQGVIRSGLFFRLYVRLTGTGEAFQAGSFVLKQGMSYAAVLEEMTNASKVEVEVTVPEGYTLQQMADLFEEKGLTTKDAWFAVVGDPAVDSRTDERLRQAKDFSLEFPFLASKPAYVSLEGYLFPDTYRFFPNAGAEEIVRRMLANFDSKLTEGMRRDLETRGHTIHEVVTMASIVEREVRTAVDRPLVADLFWRRLNAGIALQADSTVNYVTGKSDPSVLNTDRDIDSLWNTYEYPGLPPSPISNPGLAALDAAVYPEPNDAWYFLTDAEGVVHYASTNNEHNQNRALYLP